jgi:hypothetical protein
MNRDLGCSDFNRIASFKSNSCASPTDPGVQRCGHLSVCERIPRRHSAPLQLLFHILRTKIAHLSPTTGGTLAFTKFPFSMPFPLTINGRAQTDSADGTIFQGGVLVLQNGANSGNRFARGVGNCVSLGMGRGGCRRSILSPWDGEGTRFR